MADDSILKYSDIIGPDDTFEVIFANLDRLRNELESLAKDTQKGASIINPNDDKAIEELTNRVKELESALSSLDKVQKKATTTRKKLNELTQEELIEREKQKIVNRETVQTAKQLAIIKNSEAGSIERLRAQLSLTTLQWKKLSANERQNGVEGKRLVREKKKLTEQLKRLEKQTGDTRRNVGNYTSSLGRLGKVAAGVFVGRNIVSAVRRVGQAFVDVFKDNEKGNEQFIKFRKTIDGVIESLKGVALNILQVVIPIFQRVVRTFQFLIDLFQKTSEESSFLGSAFRFIGDAVKAVVGFILDLPFVFAGVIAAAKQLGTEVSEVFQKLALNAEILGLKIKKFFTLNEDAVKDLEKQIAEANKRIEDINKNSGTIFGAFQKGFDDAKASFEAFSKAQDAEDEKTAARLKRKKAAEEAAKNAEKERNERLKQQDKLLKIIEKRIEAIQSLREKVAKEQAKNIKDETERAIALEELSFKALEKQREAQFDKRIALIEEQEQQLIKIYGDNSKEVLEFRKQSQDEILELEKLNQELSEAQLKASEDRKLEIVKKSYKNLNNIATINLEEQRKREEEQRKKEFEERNKAVGIDIDQIKETQKLINDEYNKAFKQQQKDRQKQQQELRDQITETADKIAEAIVESFETQLRVSELAVEEQANAVELQRERAEKGLSNTLKFEQEQLAQREAERLRAEKKAEQAAKLQTLFNLVSAYAASGDTNALQRGLVDFALLEALGAGLQGFEEGGYTSNGGKSEVAGVVHGQEYVVTADDTKRYGLVGKSGKQFGEVMSDYFAYSPLLYNPYSDQKEQFVRGNYKKDNSNKLYEEVRAMRQAFENIKSNDYDMVEMTDNFVKIAHKVTNKRMTTINKTRKRL